MPKPETNELFPLSTCRTLRNLVTLRQKAEADRKRAFDNRDDARSRLHDAGSTEKQKATAAEDLGMCWDKIERLQVAIKGIDADIEEAIENPDQAELFDVGQLTMRDYYKEGDSKIAERVKESKAQQAADAEPQAEGENQHLAASINELDLADRLKDALLTHNLPTVGSLIQFQDKSDADDEADDLQDLMNCDEKDQKAIISSLAKFRREHRKAARAVEEGAAA